MYLMRLPRNFNKRTRKFHRTFPRDHESATLQAQNINKQWLESCGASYSKIQKEY